jgi:hypothetical protein
VAIHSCVPIFTGVPLLSALWQVPTVHSTIYETLKTTLIFSHFMCSFSPPFLLQSNINSSSSAPKRQRKKLQVVLYNLAVLQCVFIEFHQLCFVLTKYSSFRSHQLTRLLSVERAAAAAALGEEHALPPSSVVADSADASDPPSHPFDAVVDCKCVLVMRSISAAQRMPA